MKTKQGRKPIDPTIKKTSVAIYLPKHMILKIGVDKLKTELLKHSKQIYDSLPSNYN
jgi:hypothetical protein